MKLTTVFIIATIMQVSAATFGQTVTLKQNNVTLKEIFKDIRKQTGYDVLFETGLIDVSVTRDVDFKATPLMEVMQQVLNGQPVEFTIDEQSVLIRKNSLPPTDNTKSVVVAQSANITGFVTDSTSAPLVGATIMLTGTKYAAVTDEEGKFILSNIPNGKYHLLITYIGYQKYESDIELTGNNINFGKLILRTESGQLKEVVVSNGYQALPLERATGSYDQIDNAQINRSTSPDILDRINGLASGLLLSPGGNSSENGFTSAGASNPSKNQLGINIRGFTTIQSNTAPLVVLDNFPYDGDINNINPNDVESITILKDAAAASIWGAQAGNGVIVITSKKGHLNQPLKVEFSTNTTVSQKPNLYYNRNFLDANDFINVEEQLFATGFYSYALNQPGYPVGTTPVVDLLNQEQNGTISSAQANAQINALRNVDVRSQLSKYFYQAPTDQQYSLNVSGGTNKSAYIFSAGYDNDPSIEVGTGQQRITLNSQTSFNPIKNLELSGGMTYTQSKSEYDNVPGLFQNLGLYGDAYQLYPYAQLADNKGNPLPLNYKYSTEYVQSAPSMGFLNWQFYPLQELRDGDDVTNTDSYDLRANASIKYTIIPGLSVSALYQYERALTNGLNDQTQASFVTRDMINQYSNLTNGQVSGYNVPLGDILNYNYSSLTSQDFRAQLNYNKDWKKNSVSFLAGYEVRDVPATLNGYSVYGYDPNTATSGVLTQQLSFETNPLGNSGSLNQTSNNGATDNRFRSYFANAGYTYDDKYTLSASSRIDQSNIFGVKINDKSQPVWSTGFKWDIDKETFFHVNWLSLLKLRLTYGYAGNVNNTIYAVPTYQVLIDPIGYGTYPYSQLQSPGNPDLGWEKTAKLNAAADLGLFNNRITLTFEYYWNKGTNLIGTQPFPTSTGISANVGNYSDMNGSGLDLTVNSRNLDGKFKWYTQFLFSYTRNQITKYLGGNGGFGLPDNNVVIGKPVGALYALKWAGLDPQNGNPRGYLNGQVSEDYTDILNQPLVNSGSLFNTNSSWVYIGPAAPTTFGSFYNTFSYEHFSLSANIIYKLGFYFQRSSINYTQLFESGAGNSDFTKRWQKPGDEQTTNVPSMPDLNSSYGSRDQFYGESSVLFDNGNEVRLQDIDLSYNLTKQQWRKLPFNSLQFHIHANNLGLIWTANKDHLDPEYFSNGGIPAVRTLSLGLTVVL